METDKSKWCAAFLRKVRKQFHDMKSKDWLRHLLGNPKNFVITRLGACKVREDADFGAEARNDLAALFANFTYLNLPEGAALGVGGRFWNMNGSAYLTIRLPGKESFPVSNIAPDPMCVESIWENEVLAWMSSQLYLLWHNNYSAKTILLGGAESMENEIRHLDCGRKFMSSVEKMSAEMKREYLATDFSPKVEMVDGKPRIEYYVFTPFGGIFKRFAGEKKPNEPPKEQLEKPSRDTSEDNHDKVDASFDLPEEGGVSDFEVTEEGEKAVFPHWCGICY